MFRIYIIFLIFSTLYTYGFAQDPFFRKDYTYFEKYDAFYKAHRTKHNWMTALAYCEGEGAELIVPLSKEEIQDVGKLLREGALRFYVGIHDLFKEGEFVIRNGSSAEDFYLNWNQGEPNDAHDNEDCVAVNVAEVGYNDVNCGDKIHFICKKQNVGIFINEHCETYDKYYFQSTVTDKCYKFHTIPLTWHGAFSLCKSEEADLAVINSDQEAELFIALFAKYPQEYSREHFEKGLIHMGFNDLVIQGVFYTTDGKLLSETGYDNWAPNQPDNNNNAEHCGGMFRDGRLNDIACNTRAMFICEKKKMDPEPQLDIRFDPYKIQV